jgi:hypothetical protein
MTICQQVHIHSLILHIDSFIYLNKSQVYKCHMYTYAQSTRIYTCMCKPPLIIQNIPRGSRVATSGQARPYTWQCDIRSQLGSWQLSLPQLEAIPAFQPLQPKLRSPLAPPPSSTISPPERLDLSSS